MDTITLEVKDGSIEHIHYNDHKRAKNWIAIVTRNRTQPGGLQREFLKRFRSRYYSAEQITKGQFLEIAADYYSVGGRKYTKRRLYEVMSVDADEIRIRGKCELDEVPSTPT